MSKAVVKLYGQISDWGANNATLLSERLEAAATSSDSIDMHIHSYGGSVIEGSMIYNSIKKSSKPVDVYIDGIAASMASVVAMAGRKIFMSENAFIMIHAPAGSAGGRGTVADHQTSINILTATESNFVKAICARSGKDEKTVRGWLERDTWFSAEQALAERLIDKIVDPVATNVKTLTSETVKASPIEAIYNTYTALLNADENHSPINNNKPSTMNKELIIKTLGLVGVTADSSDSEIEAAIAVHAKATREQHATTEAQLQAHLNAQIADTLDGVKSKLTAEQMAEFKAVGEKCGIKALKATLEPIKNQPTLTGMIAAAASIDHQAIAMTGSASWGFDEWQKNNPRGLEALAKSDYDSFNALYKARFGVDAPR